MAFDNSSHQRKSNARSLEILYPLQSLEHTKKLAVIGHIEANTIIFDRVSDVVLGFDRRNSDDRDRLPGRIFDGIFDEIVPDLPQQGRIPEYHRQLADAPLDLAIGNGVPERATNFAHHLLHIHRFQGQLRATKL
ncbi:hypothetical protein D3C78_1268060 [compost metagenome]